MTVEEVQVRKKPTLAAVAIAKNERRDIVGFIANLSAWVDEIVVVDDGSTDGTVEYLETCGFPVKIVHRTLDKVTGFAAQRNAGLEAATSDWLLHMDIDERVTPELGRAILAAIVDTDKNAFRYRRLNFFLHRPFDAGGWDQWNYPQLGRRGAHRFVNPIHEAVEVDGGDAKIGQLPGRMWHLNDDSYVERIQKNVRYSQFSAVELLKKGKKIRWWNMLTAPTARAFKAYVIRGAWRYGELGLIFAVFTFLGSFNWYAVAWDEQNRRDRDEIEQELQRKWFNGG